MIQNGSQHNMMPHTAMKANVDHLFDFNSLLQGAELSFVTQWLAVGVNLIHECSEWREVDSKGVGQGGTD